MTAYIYKGTHQISGWLLVIKSNGKVISQKMYATETSAKDDAKHCTPGNY